MESRNPWSRAAVLAGLLAAAVPAYAGFNNGGFETGDYTGWTKSSFMNPGLTGNQPYSSISIVRNAGGATSESVVVTATATMAGIDALLSASAALRFPEYGTYSARVNGSVTGQHSNTIMEQGTMVSGDVDPDDGKVHIRFAFAPVLQNPGHAAAQQPYAYVGVRNVSRSNALLYEYMVFAGQAGVPWKTSGTLNYTDWQVVDIAPDNSQLAIGDVVSIEVTAAGCSQGGHYGYVYFDGFGTGFIPGLSVVAAADKTLVTSGDSLNYSFTYRNSGTGPANNVIVSETLSSSVTFVSVSDPAHCSQAAGVVTCNFGTMVAGSSGTFSVATTVGSLPANASGFINNGNYSIRGDGVTSTLGPLVAVPVQGPATDLSIAQSVSPATVVMGGNLTYSVVVTNKGTNAAQNVAVADTLPAGLTLVSATPTQGICTGNPAITCSLGNIAYPGSASVTVVAQTTAAGVISSSVSVSASSTDSDLTNNSTTTVATVIAPPAAPVGLAGTALGTSSITWSWNAISTATGYQFYPSTGGAPIVLSGTVVTQTRLSTNTAFGGRVSALFAGGAGLLSDYATAYTLAAVPVAAAFSGVGAAGLTANWTANGNPAGTTYTAVLSTGASPATNGFAGNATVVTTALSASFTGLNPGTAYYAAVSAQNGGGVPTAYASLASTVTATTAPVPSPYTAVGSSAATANWGSAGNPAGTVYTVVLSTGASPATNGFAGNRSTTTVGLATVFGGLTPNTTYYGTLQAAAGAFTDLTPFVTLAAPPVSLAVVSVAVTGLSASWSADGNPDGTAYLLEASASPDFSTIAVSSATTAVVAPLTGLTPNTSWYLRVTAFNWAGVPSSAAGPVTAVTLPATPGDPAVTAAARDALTLGWSAGGDPADTVFTVDLSTAADFSGSVASSQTVGVSASFSSLTPATTYYGRVSAAGRTGAVSSYSGTGHWLTNALPPGAPVLSGYAVSSSTIRWSWTPVTGPAAASFQLFASSTAVSPVLTPDASYYLETGLTLAVLYSRYLTAFNGAGVAYSSTDSVSIPYSTSTALGGADAAAQLADPRTGGTALEVPAGAAAHTMRWLVSADPRRQPLVDATVDLLARAVPPQGLVGSTDSIREFIVTIDDVRYQGGFAQPVMVSVPYPDAHDTGVVDGTLVPADSLRLFVLDENSAVWQPVAGAVVDKVHHVVRGAAPHLSIYGVFGTPVASTAASDLSQARVFPNPWRPGSAGAYDAPSVTFTNLTADAVVRIYTLSGTLVRRLDKADATNQAAWDGRNDAGSRVATGVYYYVVTGPSGQAKGRLAVLR
jgi:uncharacterized repeat protein (TIGR01451 family)